MSFYLKDPQSRVDYAIDWSPYLDGQTIETSDWAGHAGRSGRDRRGGIELRADKDGGAARRWA